jgi:hypothetical protein
MAESEVRLHWQAVIVQWQKDFGMLPAQVVQQSLNQVTEDIAEVEIRLSAARLELEALRQDRTCLERIRSELPVQLALVVA